MNVIKNIYLRGIELDLGSGLPLIIESVSGGVNGGCNLYIGKAQSECSIIVKNISGDVIEFYNPIQGSIIPFSVTEIIAVNNVSKVVALW